MMKKTNSNVEFGAYFFTLPKIACRKKAVDLSRNKFINGQLMIALNQNF